MDITNGNGHYPLWPMSVNFYHLSLSQQSFIVKKLFLMMLIAISDNIDESSSVQAYRMPFTLDVNMYIWCCRLSSNRFQFGFQPTTRWRIHSYENCQCCWLSMIYGLVETRHPVWYNWVHPKNSIISRTWLEVILNYGSPFFVKKWK